jgi:hypothetical protein
LFLEGGYGNRAHAASMAGSFAETSAELNQKVQTENWRTAAPRPCSLESCSLASGVF